MKKTIYYFTSNNVRSLTNPSPDEIGRVTKFPHIWDPDLSAVERLPRHLWKLQDGRVLPLSDAEKVERLANIAKHGVDNGNSVELAALVFQSGKRTMWLYCAAVIGLLAVAVLVWRVI